MNDMAASRSKPFAHARPLRFDLYQVPDKARGTVGSTVIPPLGRD